MIKVCPTCQRPFDQATRSLDQNAYYWGVVLTLIAEHTGYETDELHELFKQRFNPMTVLGDTIGGSTKKLGTSGFSAYVERIRRFALTELQIDIPEPNQPPLSDLQSDREGVC